jgi:hypothetical protein
MGGGGRHSSLIADATSIEDRLLDSGDTKPSLSSGSGGMLAVGGSSSAIGAACRR